MSSEFSTGYLHPAYAECLTEWGTPRLLPRSGAWILERQIAGTQYRDAMGCYPLFCCPDWSQLAADLDELAEAKRELVSLTVVTDPRGDYDVPYLQHCFDDVVIPFKEHLMVDLSREMNTFVTGHHRRYALKALRSITVEKCRHPAQFLNEWVDLYANLIQRHDIRGISSFSSASFEKQLQVPGMVMFKAMQENRTVGMTLWYVQGDAAYYHLGAYSQLGYDLRASFALFWRVMETFAADGLRWLSLGAGAGAATDAGSEETAGLARFKRGWATGSQTAYLCGRVFDAVRYAALTKANDLAPGSYFPAYRKGEFS